MTNDQLLQLDMFTKRATAREAIGGHLTDQQFRRGLMDDYMATFSATNAKAATIYNVCKKYCEQSKEYQKLVRYLGRKATAGAKPVLVNNTTPTVTKAIQATTTPVIDYGKDDKRADSRTLWSAVELSEDTNNNLVVEYVCSFYSKEEAINHAGNRDGWMVVKGSPENGVLTSTLRDIRL